MWIAVGALLLALLVAAAVRGVRGRLRSMGVRPRRRFSRCVAVNVVAVIAIVAFAFWKWVS
jgi:hypothetical protein